MFSFEGLVFIKSVVSSSKVILIVVSDNDNLHQSNIKVSL